MKCAKCEKTIAKKKGYLKHSAIPDKYFHKKCLKFVSSLSRIEIYTKLKEYEVPQYIGELDLYEKILKHP